jgi:hypothetical protein
VVPKARQTRGGIRRLRCGRSRPGSGQSDQDEDPGRRSGGASGLTAGDQVVIEVSNPDRRDRVHDVTSENPETAQQDRLPSPQRPGERDAR